MTKVEALKMEYKEGWKRFWNTLSKEFIRAIVVGFGILISFVLALFLLGGCAKKTIIKLEKRIEKVEMTNTPSEVHMEWERTRVRKGDSLWKISKTGYGTGMLWPLLWKANRDEIANPDLIYPGQILRVKAEPDILERKEAMEKAGEWK